MTTTPTMTKQALSQHLGVSRMVCDRLISEGLPFEGDIGRQRFDPRAVARWLLARGEAAAGGGPGIDVERERLIKAQADRAELELAKARGQVIDAAAVAQTWGRTFREIRDILRGMPRGAVDRIMVASAEGRPALAAALLAEIDDCLTRASTVKVVVKLDDPADDDDDAA